MDTTETPSFADFLKGKSGLTVFERWSDIKSKYRNREFWSKRLLSAQKNTRKIAENLQNRLKEGNNCGRHLVMTIAEYIQNHLKKDNLSDQLTQDLSAPFTDGK